MACGNPNSELVVVGGGIVGAMAALAASQRGVAVTVFEGEPELFRGATRAGFGSLTPFSDPFFLGAARDFAARSVDLYRNTYLPWLEETTGRGIDFCDDGLLDLIDSEKAATKALDLHDDLVASGYEHEVKRLDRAEVLALEPNLADDFESALWLNEPWLDTQHLLEAVSAALSRDRNIELRLGETVRRVAQTGEGWTIQTETGLDFGTGYVLLATGASHCFPEGPPPPQLWWMRGDAVEMVPRDGRRLLRRHVYRGEGFITPRSDGRLLLGATYEREPKAPSGTAAQPDRISFQAFTQITAQNRRILPALESCDIIRVWRGWRPASLDNFPILGTGEGDGIAYATGCIGLGITMAPAIAEAAVSGLLDSSWADVPDAFSPARIGALEPEIGRVRARENVAPSA